MTGLMSLCTRTARFEIRRETLLIQTLAVQLLRRHFPYTELVTDEKGLWIADRLRWPFDSITTHGEQIPEVIIHGWSAIKFYAYLAQEQPFVHVDGDFLLFDPLPMAARVARVLVQSRDEPAFYLKTSIRDKLEAAGVDYHVGAYNTGIFGGQDLALIHDYARFGIELYHRMKHVKEGTVLSVAGEQGGLGVFLRKRRVSPYQLIPLPLSAAEVDFEACRFTHCWAWTKGEKQWADAAEVRLLEEFPRAYQDFTEGFALLPQATAEGRSRVFGE